MWKGYHITPLHHTITSILNLPLPPITLQAAQHPNDKRGYINEVLNHVGPRAEPMLNAWGLKLAGVGLSLMSDESLITP